jgi:hypothetical protein
MLVIEYIAILVFQDTLFYCVWGMYGRGNKCVHKFGCKTLKERRRGRGKDIIEMDLK